MNILMLDTLFLLQHKQMSFFKYTVSSTEIIVCSHSWQLVAHCPHRRSRSVLET